MADGSHIKWTGALEEAFEAEVERQGGVQSARPKALLDALQPMFPDVGLQVRNVKWHLQAHRKREERAQEWLASTEGPVRWTGRLKAAFQKVVAELGGVHSARPKQVWEALHEEYPMLTQQNIKWHLQTLRKKEPLGAASGAAGGAAASSAAGGRTSPQLPGSGAQSAAQPGGSGSSSAAMTISAASAGASAVPAGSAGTGAEKRHAGVEGDVEMSSGDQGTSSQGSDDLRKAKGAAEGRPADAAQSHEQRPLSRQGQTGGQPQQQQQQQQQGAQWQQQLEGVFAPGSHAPWEGPLVKAAEKRLHGVRKAVHCVAQLVEQLRLRAAGQAELLTLLESGADVRGDPRLLPLLQQLHVECMAPEAALEMAQEDDVWLEACDSPQLGEPAGQQRGRSRGRQQQLQLGEAAAEGGGGQEGAPRDAGLMTLWEAAMSPPCSPTAQQAEARCQEQQQQQQQVEARGRQGQPASASAAAAWQQQQQQQVQPTQPVLPAQPAMQQQPALPAGLPAMQQQQGLALQPKQVLAMQQQHGIVMQQQQQALAAQEQAVLALSAELLSAGLLPPIFSLASLGSLMKDDHYHALEQQGQARAVHHPAPQAPQPMPAAAPGSAAAPARAPTPPGAGQQAPGIGLPATGRADAAYLQSVFAQQLAAIQQAAAQQAASSSSTAGPGPSSSAAPSSGAAPGPGSPAEAAALLSAAHPQLDPRVCLAICQAVPMSNPQGQAAVAACLAATGVSQPQEIAALLEGGSPQSAGLARNLELARARTQEQGVRLTQWAALLAACKQLG